MKLILGVGSPFGQDTIASLVIDKIHESLQDEFLKKKEVHVEYSDRPGLRLIELIKPYDEVIVIDAVVSGSPIGTIHCLSGLDQLSRFSQATSSHGFGVAEALSLAETLGLLPDKLTIFGIEIDQNASQIPSQLINQANVLICKIVNWAKNHQGSS